MGEQFLQALADGDFVTAYGLCVPELQQELGSADQLASMFGPGGLQIESWNYETQPMTLKDGRSGFALVGDVTFSAGKTGVLSVVLVHVDEAFRVAGFSVEPDQDPGLAWMLNRDVMEWSERRVKMLKVKVNWKSLI